jgi:hypothetical protein
MTRRTAWGMSVIFGAAVFAAGGCDTPREIKEARPIGGDEEKSATSVSSEKSPEKSDPAAAATVAAAVAAHTGGKPELLEQFKSVKFTRVGQAVGTGAEPIRQTWQLHAAWPDKLRNRAELPGGKVVTLGLAGETAWAQVSGEAKAQLPPNLARDFKLDSSAEWLWMLFPLTDPRAVFATAPDTSVNGKPTTGVRVWVPGITNATLHFDKETKLLVFMAFEGRESEQKVIKEVTMPTTRLFHGVKLPETMIIRSGGRVWGEWTMSAFDPEPKLDPKLFDGP